MKDYKLIAEFMGWNTRKATTIPNNLHLSNLELDNGEVMELQYATSWEWLMPVAEKCLTTDEPRDEHHYFINDALLTCNIEVVYEAVVKFIKAKTL